MADIDDERVRQRAHEIWESEGRPEGRHDEHWRRARAELEQELERRNADIGPQNFENRPPAELEDAITRRGSIKNVTDKDMKIGTGSGERGAP